MLASMAVANTVGFVGAFVILGGKAIVDLAILGTLLASK